MEKTIIIYFTSSTKHSETIAKKIEGDHYEIKTDTKIPKNKTIQMIKLGFMTKTGKGLNPIDPKVDFTLYDKVYVVAPIWAGDMAPVMKKYVMKNSAQIISKNPEFIFSSGSGKGPTAETFINKNFPQATVKQVRGIGK